MSRLLSIVILLLPVITKAQGIQFEHHLTWEQIKQKAKGENKFIFMDCAASWCKPCKQMDKEVFPLKEVGDYMNVNFVSVHVQMDTSKTDDEEIRSWYKNAHDLQQQYKVTTFPSYLFFSPDSKLVHRFMYSLPAKDFLKTASEALDPNKQYIVLLENYLSGKKEYSRLIYLSVSARNMKEDSLANKIASDYLHNYLDKQSEKEVLQKKNLQFIEVFPNLLNSKDNVFKFIYRNKAKIDSIMNQKDKGSLYVQRVITKEEIDPKLWKNNKPVAETPNWDKLNTTIKKKYNQWYADKTVLDAQIGWYLRKRDSAQILKYRVRQIDKYGLDTAGLGWVFINNFLWDYVFSRCNNKDTLNKAAGWIEQIIKNHPDDAASYDTYANLLYKAGRKEEAIHWETKAMELDKEQAEKDNKQPDMNYANTLDKMKKGFPTW